MKHLVLYFSNALHSPVWAINSKCASLHDQAIYYYAIINRLDEYGYKILPARLCGYGYAFEFRLLSRAGICSTRTIPDPFPCPLWKPNDQAAHCRFSWVVFCKNRTVGPDTGVSIAVRYSVCITIFYVDRTGEGSGSWFFWSGPQARSGPNNRGSK